MRCLVNAVDPAPVGPHPQVSPANGDRANPTSRKWFITHDEAPSVWRPGALAEDVGGTGRRMGSLPPRRFAARSPNVSGAEGGAAPGPASTCIDLLGVRVRRIRAFMEHSPTPRAVSVVLNVTEDGRMIIPAQALASWASDCTTASALRVVDGEIVVDTLDAALKRMQAEFRRHIPKAYLWSTS